MSVLTRRSYCVVCAAFRWYDKASQSKLHTSGKRQMNKIIYLTIRSGCLSGAHSTKNDENILTNKIIFWLGFISVRVRHRHRHRRRRTRTMRPKEHRRNEKKKESVPKMDGTLVSSCPLCVSLTSFSAVIHLRMRWRRNTRGSIRKWPQSLSALVGWRCSRWVRRPGKRADVFSETQSFARCNAHLHFSGVVAAHNAQNCVRSCIITWNGYN